MVIFQLYLSGLEDEIIHVLLLLDTSKSLLQKVTVVFTLKLKQLWKSFSSVHYLSNEGGH
jgi:hypothetical protein